MISSDGKMEMGGMCKWSKSRHEKERMRRPIAYILPPTTGLLGQSHHPTSPRQFLSTTPDTSGGGSDLAREFGWMKEC